MKTTALLIYMSRSGSTLLSSLLNSYKPYQTSAETDIYKWLAYVPEIQLHDVKMIYKGIENRSLAGKRVINKAFFENRFKNLGERSFSSISNCILESFFNCHSDVIIIKNRGLAWYLFELAERVPELKYIHIIRDGRAVLSSQYDADRVYKTGKMAVDPILPAITWKKWNDFVSQFQSAYPEKICEIRFEDLINKTDIQMAKIHKFLLGNEPPEKNRNYGNYKNQIPIKELGLHENVGKDPIHGNVDKWKKKLKKKDIIIFEIFAGRALLNNGYRPLYVNNNRLRWIFKPPIAVHMLIALLKACGRKTDNLKYKLLHRLGLWNVN